MGILEKLKGALVGESIDFTELEKAGAIIVDVRTTAEFESGHVKGSKNIPLHLLNDHLDELKNQTVILVCKSGARAGQAKNLLTGNGIEAYNVGAWQNI